MLKKWPVFLHSDMRMCRCPVLLSCLCGLLFRLDSPSDCVYSFEVRDLKSLV